MSNENKYKGLLWIVIALLLIVLVAYNLYSGLTVRKIGIPGIFELEFGEVQTGGRNSTTTQKVPPDEIIRRIEELQQHLANNENEQDRARREIERLGPMTENDPDAVRAIEDQERWLKRLTIEREHMEDELRRQSEQR
jgi:flagellar basal body-associated protein FliL